MGVITCDTSGASVYTCETARVLCPKCGVTEYTVHFETAAGEWAGPYCVQCLAEYMIESRHGLPVLQPIKGEAV